MLTKKYFELNILN